MALARARRSESAFNYWPGFVDALSTLVLSIVFLLSVFLVVQFFLSQEVTGKDKALDELNRKIAQLNELLSVEKLGKLNLEDQLAQFKAGLASAEARPARSCATCSSRFSLPSFSSDSISLSCAILALSCSSALSLPVTSCDR